MGRQLPPPRPALEWLERRRPIRRLSRALRGSAALDRWPLSIRAEACYAPGRRPAVVAARPGSVHPLVADWIAADGRPCRKRRDPKPRARGGRSLGEHEPGRSTANASRESRIVAFAEPAGSRRGPGQPRSEERRVGKEWRTGWQP